MKTWESALTVEDLPNEDLKIVADMCGLDLAVKLLEDMPGTIINVPKTGLNKFRNKYICKQYDGSKQSRSCLAFEFGVSEGYIIQLACRSRKNARLN
jgi:hypothetical protein